VGKRDKKKKVGGEILSPIIREKEKGASGREDLFCRTVGAGGK